MSIYAHTRKHDSRAITKPREINPVCRLALHHPAASTIVQRAALSPESLRPAELVRLQQTLGNQAVGAFLTRSVSRPVIQAKLTVNAPGDEYEREADRVADAVMRTPAVQRAESEDEDEEPEVMTKREPAHALGGAFEVGEEFEQRLRAGRGHSEPLPAGLRQEFEAKFGADFSPVRIHTDTRSDQLNESIRSHAFTTGHDVFFGQGAYEPGSREGRALIAHELTHVMQQEAQLGTGAALVVQRGRFKKLREKANEAKEALEKVPEKAEKAASTTAKLTKRAAKETADLAKRQAVFTEAAVKRKVGNLPVLADELRNIPTYLKENPPWKQEFSQARTVKLSAGYADVIAGYNVFAQDLQAQGDDISRIWAKKEIEIMLENVRTMMNRFANDDGFERESVQRNEGVDETEAKRLLADRTSALALAAQTIQQAIDEHY